MFPPRYLFSSPSPSSVSLSFSPSLFHAYNTRQLLNDYSMAGIQPHLTWIQHCSPPSSAVSRPLSPPLYLLSPLSPVISPPLSVVLALFPFSLSLPHTTQQLMKDQCPRGATTASMNPTLLSSRLSPLFPCLPSLPFPSSFLSFSFICRSFPPLSFSPS